MCHADTGVTSTVGRSTVTGSVGALLPNDGMIGKSFSMRYAEYKHVPIAATAMVAGTGATAPMTNAPVPASPVPMAPAANVKRSGVMADEPAPATSVRTESVD